MKLFTGSRRGREVQSSLWELSAVPTREKMGLQCFKEQDSANNLNEFGSRSLPQSCQIIAQPSLVLDLILAL